MKNNCLPNPFHTRQTGAALITGLIFLVVLTMIGITAARMSTLEERMSGNMRDRSIAMQAAELTLRDAERDIMGQGTSIRVPSISGISDFAAGCNQDATANTADDGLCYNGAAGYTPPIWTTVNMMAAPSVAYGRFTGAAVIPQLSAQPRYIIEGIRKTPPGGGETFYYRITVRAQGTNPNTVVWLQELFKPI
jgi:type IV pilus assembly protein PilX